MSARAHFNHDVVLSFCLKCVPNAEVVGFTYGWVVAEDRCINVPAAVTLAPLLQRAEWMRTMFRQRKNQKPSDV